MVLAAGPSECGKTTALYEMFVRACPRRVSFDFQAEIQRKFNPDAITVYSYADFMRALKACARYSRWHIALVYDPEAEPEVAEQVVNVLNPKVTGPDHRSYSIAVGGIALDCSEADFLFPNGRTAPAVRGLVQRGRHNRLAVFMATHAPALVDPRLRDAADYFLAFRSQETRVFKFWQDTASTAVADTIASLPLYHCAYIVKGEQRVYLLDQNRRVRRVLDYTGAVV